MKAITLNRKLIMLIFSNDTMPAEKKKKPNELKF